MDSWHYRANRQALTFSEEIWHFLHDVGSRAQVWKVPKTGQLDDNPELFRGRLAKTPERGKRERERETLQDLQKMLESCRDRGSQGLVSNGFDHKKYRYLMISIDSRFETGSLWLT